MIEQVLLDLPEAIHAALWRHLLRHESEVEQAAFVFGRYHVKEAKGIFQYVEWLAVPPEGFIVQSEFHFELTDETRASVIKRAHDLGASLIEFHSHAGRWPARFSPSDRIGFREFVHHVMWRLKGRPYAAVVVSRSGHDGLVWLAQADEPRRLGGLLVDGRVLPSTGLTPLSMDDEYE